MVLLEYSRSGPDKCLLFGFALNSGSPVRRVVFNHLASLLAALKLRPPAHENGPTWLDSVLDSDAHGKGYWALNAGPAKFAGFPIA
jgi:hypothetical protein